MSGGASVLERWREKYEFLRLSGRCANGAERDGGAIFHAVLSGDWVAVCGAHPGRTSAGWSSHEGDSVTCYRCLRKLTRLSPAAAGQDTKDGES